MKVDNAVILAAGTSSRFAPLSYELHKAFIEIRGEILLERQIEQLLDAGVPEIIIVTGYKAEQFDYLIQKYGVKLKYNQDYLVRNNNSSIWTVKDYLNNSYVCSSDNYFSENPFETDVEGAYYSAQYAFGPTGEWCLTEDTEGYINSVHIGGTNAWYMFGHAFWDADFSKTFSDILLNEYNQPGTAEKLWEEIFSEHLNDLKMKIKKYSPGMIFEFDTLDELREFDPSYIENTRSKILKSISAKLSVLESDLYGFKAIKDKESKAIGFTFEIKEHKYQYLYVNSSIKQINN